jgi:hypothetical protein
MKAESEFFPTSILFLSGPDVGANNGTDDQLRMGEQQLTNQWLWPSDVHICDWKLNRICWTGVDLDRRGSPSLLQGAWHSAFVISSLSKTLRFG